MAKHFPAFLQEQRQGGLVSELTDDLAELVIACTEVQKPGSLTLTIEVKPGRAGTLEITDKVKVKMPEPPRGVELWWAEDDGTLTDRDPRQPTLPGTVAEVPPLDDDDEHPVDGKSAAAGD